MSGRMEAAKVGRHVAWLKSERPDAEVFQIAHAAGVSPKTVRKTVAADPGEMMFRRTAVKILAVRPEHLDQTGLRRRVPGEPTRALVEDLQGRGWTLAVIAQEAGLSKSTLLGRNLRQVQVDTARRVERAHRRLTCCRPAGDGAPAWQVLTMQRHVEGLATQGWSGPAVAREAGVSPHVLRAVMAGQRSPRMEVAEAVEGAYRRLRYRVGPSPQVAAMARRAGKAPWAAWRGREIGDAGAVPDVASVDDPEWRGAMVRRYGVGETRAA